MRKYLIFCFSLMLCAFTVHADNWLLGDTDCETEIRNLTSGPWTNHNAAEPRLSWDSSTGYESKSSLHVYKQGAIGMQTVTLPAGKYVFSCWAKGDADGVRATFSVVKQNINWYILAEERAKTEIRLTKEWKRYTLPFESDGKTVLVPHFGVFTGDAWFDRFMISSGTDVGAWTPSTVPYGRVIFPKGNTQVFDYGQDVPITLELHAMKFQGKPAPQPLQIVVSNHFGKTVLRETVPVRFDADGRFCHQFVLPGKESGWYRITGSIDGLLSCRDAAVIARPARSWTKQQSHDDAFLGLYAAERAPELYQRLGVRWLDLAMDWRKLEPQQGQVDFSSGEMIKKYKAMGFKIKLSFFTCAPPWLFSAEELAAAKKLGTHSHNLMVTEEQSNTLWRNLTREFLKRYAEYVDVFEIGAEVDAMVGLSVYNKSLSPNEKIANFAGGQTLNRLCRWTDVTAEEIRRIRPDAEIAAVRPSDVDARYHYAYSRAVFERCGKWVNSFGIDCYPQPRWIGPEVPPTGTEQQLKVRFADARSAMKGNCIGDAVFVSEYGYFVDVNEIFNPAYTMIQVNRMTRSLLQARLLGMKHFSYFHGGGSGLEGNRYHMGLQFSTVPLPATAALSTVANVVNDVTQCQEIMLTPRIGGGVFKYADNSGTAALWSIADGYSPSLEISGLDAVFTDVMGNPLTVQNSGNRVLLQLSALPIYIHAKDFAALSAAVKNARLLDDSPLDVRFRPENLKLLKVFLQNNSQETLFGSMDHPAGTRRFKLTAGAVQTVMIPGPKPGQEVEYQFQLRGRKNVRKISYRRPVPMTIPNVASCQLDGTLGSWQGAKTMLISGHERVMPLDHTTYSGASDLSGKLYLARNGDDLLIAVHVTDDQIRKGDTLELGFDPLNNHMQPINGSDPDDLFVTLAADGRLQLRGKRAAALQKVCKSKVVMDLAGKRVLYQFSIPLSALDPRLTRPGNIFGFNLAICDDDSGSGADYWLELRPGLLGTMRPDLFQEVTIE